MVVVVVVVVVVLLVVVVDEVEEGRVETNIVFDPLGGWVGEKISFSHQSP